MILERPPGVLPSNKKELKEHAKVVTLKNGKELTMLTHIVVEKEKAPEKVLEKITSSQEDGTKLKK